MFPQYMRSDIQALIDQCTLPIRIRSCIHPKMSVVLRPKFPHLYSGSTMTTPVNNVASITLGYALTLPAIIDEKAFVDSAASCGYKITGVEPVPFHELQFLKHSPTFVGGQLHALINFGVFLRASGTIKGDYPGRGPLVPRMRSFQKALIAGVYPYVSCPFVDAMRKTFAAAQDSKESQTYVADLMKRKVVSLERKTIRLTDAEFFQRYQPTAVDLSDAHLFATSDVCTSSNFPFFSRVLELDYQLTTTNKAVTLSYDGSFYSHKRQKA